VIELLVCSFPVNAIVFAASRPSSSLWGYVVPGLIFAVAFAVTWALYRRFAGQRRNEP
jgi:lipopolysaccharide export LptBFGC system permease protein LptF